ncbi:MAG: hypothetical protein IJJ22_05245, partial [Oscillospiraceae bacterium]|nr:hypothetical protein [Oscillospiraceae bacterium]
TATNVGEYTGRIVPSAAALGNSTANYDITYIAGKLTIRGNAPGLVLTLTPVNYNGEYDGRQHTAYAVPNIQNGTTVEYNIDGTWMTNPPSAKDAGTVTYQVRARNNTYGTVYGTVTINITRAPVVVTAQDAQKNAQAKDPDFTATVTGLKNGESEDLITYTFKREEGEVGGTYAIYPTGAAVQGNYTVTYVPGTLTINPFGKPEPEINQDPPGTDPTGPGTLGDPIEIRDPDVPLANMRAWALLNLILGIITVITGALMSISLIKKPKEDEDEKEQVRSNEDTEEEDKKRKKSKLLGIIPAVVAVITFILTEDMRNPMVFVDKWTILMAIYAVAGLLLAYFTRNKKDEEKEEEEQTNG